MTTPNRQPKLIHVRNPVKRITLTFEPVVPPDGPITEAPLIHVANPVKHIEMTFEPVPPVVTVVELPLLGEDKGEQTFASLNSIIQKVNEIEAIRGRAGMWVDGTQSGVREGKVEIVLAPNDPTDALNTCKRVARILFELLNSAAGITVKVFAADRPDAPVYELAA
jgi:hypothetical protein